MLLLNAKAISKPARQVTLVELTVELTAESQAEHCATCCHPCGPKTPVNIEIAGDFAGAVNMQLSTRDQLSLLFNSLGLPLVCFLIGGSLAEWFGWNEPVIIFSTVVGFFIGIFLCRTKPSTVIQVKQMASNSYQN